MPKIALGKFFTADLLVACKFDAGRIAPAMTAGMPLVRFWLGCLQTPPAPRKTSLEGWQASAGYRRNAAKLLSERLRGMRQLDCQLLAGRLQSIRWIFDRVIIVVYVAGGIGLLLAWYYWDFRFGIEVVLACLIVGALAKVAEKLNDIAEVSRTRRLDDVR
jgi:hypothetical protein